MAGEWDELLDVAVPFPRERFGGDGRALNGHHPNSRKALLENLTHYKIGKPRTHKAGLRDSHAADKLLRDFSGGE